VIKILERMKKAERQCFFETLRTRSYETPGCPTLAGYVVVRRDFLTALRGAVEQLVEKLPADMMEIVERHLESVAERAQQSFLKGARSRQARRQEREQYIKECLGAGMSVEQIVETLCRDRGDLVRNGQGRVSVRRTIRPEIAKLRREVGAE
jgi:hypothetical protein